MADDGHLKNRYSLLPCWIRCESLEWLIWNDGLSAAWQQGGYSWIASKYNGWQHSVLRHYFAHSISRTYDTAQH